MAETAFTVDNPEIKARLQDISKRIGHGLPPGWGFLLMLFEFGTDANPGGSFYASNADRADAIKMLKEWIDQQEQEINPDHPTTIQMRSNWHKIVALLLSKYARDGVVITADDMIALGAEQVSVAAKEQADGLHVWLVTTEEARRLARDGAAHEETP